MSDQAQPKGTLVLVHGGWFGGWCWQAVAEKLRGNGFAVYTPTLTGLGERSHLASPLITLKTHAQDIANVLIYEDLRDVFLLGHSYSGMPLTLVPGLAADRIKHMIYLDAFVPQHGECLADLIEAPIQRDENGSWLTPPPPLSRWHIDDPELIAAIKPRLTPQPHLFEQERVDTKALPTLPSSYISLTKHQKSHFVNVAKRLQHNPNWQMIDLDAGHLVMLEEPEKLVGCLKKVVQTLEKSC